MTKVSVCLFVGDALIFLLAGAGTDSQSGEPSPVDLLRSKNLDDRLKCRDLITQHRIEMSDDPLERELYTWIIGQVEGTDIMRILIDRKMDKADPARKKRYES